MTGRWGDDDPESELPASYESEVDSNGIKTVVEYLINPADNTKMKVTRKVKVSEKTVRVNKKVAERRKWPKFGECSHLGAGIEPGVTIIGDICEFRLENQKKVDKEAADTKPSKATLGITCSHCGQYGDHWSLKCPFRGKLSPIGNATNWEEESLSTSPPSAGVSQAGTKRFVVPARRNNGNTEGESMGRKKDETATVRVTNLSEDITESDLQTLFRTYGTIQRIFLAKDTRDPSKNKGYAFINFLSRDSAANAIQNLSGVGYDHLILHCEWAKPSSREKG